MILAALAVTIWLCAIAGLLARRLQPHQCYGLCAVANALGSIAFLTHGLGAPGATAAAVGAWSAYLWWRGGGGTGMRRRLRQAFRGVRRTPASPS